MARAPHASTMKAMTTGRPDMTTTTDDRGRSGSPRKREERQGWLMLTAIFVAGGMLGRHRRARDLGMARRHAPPDRRRAAGRRIAVSQLGDRLRVRAGARHRARHGAGLRRARPAHFDDYELAKTVGVVALALILFEGGLAAGFREIRPVLRPALALALVGTTLTALLRRARRLVAARPQPLEGLLLGSILAATDGAAIFAILRGSTLRRRVARTLEGEAGLNDPVAVLLVLGFSAVDHDRATASPTWLGAFAVELPSARSRPGRRLARGVGAPQAPAADDAPACIRSPRWRWRDRLRRRRRAARLRLPLRLPRGPDPRQRPARRARQRWRPSTTAWPGSPSS